MGNRIIIYDTENLRFGTKVTVVYSNKNIERKGVVLSGKIGFENNDVYSISVLKNCEICLGWT